MLGVVALVFGPATSSPADEHDPIAMSAAVLAPAAVVDGDVAGTPPPTRRDVPAVWLVAAALGMVVVAARWSIGPARSGIAPGRHRFVHSRQRRGPPALVV